MEKRKALALLFLVALLGGFCTASAFSPTKIVRGFLSNVFYALWRRLWSLSPPTKGVVSGKAGMRFESGYSVETVFDGSKAGIEPYSVSMSPDGELLVLDSANSNIYRISAPLSRYSRPKLLAGSAEGNTGHVDGRLREARMNHPKSFTVDERGNIYIADTMNRAIRKISDLGITTIAGGKWSMGGHVDGPSEDAKLSNDFEVVYMSGSCSLLVVDRGNQAIREIPLGDEDCALQYVPDYIPIGAAIVVASIIFGYVLGFLHRKIGTNEVVPTKEVSSPSLYQPYNHPMRSSQGPPVIPFPVETKPKKQEQTVPLYTVTETNHTPANVDAGSTFLPILGSILSVFRRRKPEPEPILGQSNHPISANSRLASRVPDPRKSYTYLPENPAKLHRVKGGRPAPREVDLAQRQYVQRHRQYASGPQTCYESTNEVVFGAVQESGQKRAMDIRPINYGDPFYDPYAMRARRNQMRY
ncbi:NHL domain-containing protein [Rhynchospora pubera]|uniref:NHL domain-containing protein n=1 Tax=Rhynchospora pubera TaxID=906938 RepID=A0AAV8H5F5_9POAL|nr:NHL domain-containing protein [Rhynchospora pubera]